MTASESVFEAYERRLASSRERFVSAASAREVANGSIGPEPLEIFLMWFTALGQHMARPVAGWLRRAGERCQQLGAAELGKALVRHAGRAEGQDQALRDGARSLVKRWNGRRGEAPIDTGRLLGALPTAGVRRYVELHRRVTGGPAPWGQIAIEYEVERLSTTWCGAFVRTCLRTLGQDLRPCLPFLEEDEVRPPDAARSSFRAEQLDRFLRERPEALEDLAPAGEGALDAYAEYLDDCLWLTRSEALFRP